MYQSLKTTSTLLGICQSWEVTNKASVPSHRASHMVVQSHMQRTGCDKASQTDTQIWCAYPPRLLSNRRWGKVKGIYQRKGKKKNNINKAAENSYITHEQNIWALATSLLCALCSLAVTSACACYWLFAQHITRALPCNSCSHEINEGSMQKPVSGNGQSCKSREQGSLWARRRACAISNLPSDSRRLGRSHSTLSHCTWSLSLWVLES